VCEVKRILAMALAIVLVCAAVGLADGVLRITFAWPCRIDPAVGSDQASSSALLNMYDTLVYPDTSGNALAHVATSWEVSDDSLVWTFHLRNDVRFHDGTTLTAEDVKYSMDRLLTTGEGYAFLFLGRVESTAAIDDYTVRFTFSKPFGPFLTTLYRLYILNKDLVEAQTSASGPYGEKGDYGKGFLTDHDAGSGPYTCREFRVEEELVMDKNPSYWMPMDAQAPSEVHFIGTTEAATVRTLLARGELEISDQWQTNEAFAALDQIDGVDVMAMTPGQAFYMMIHNRKAPTDDIHFRKAMAYAMDYQTVVTQIFPGTVQARGPVPQNVPGADPTVFQYTRDLAKAREELALSPYDPDKYPIEIHWVAEVPDEEKICLLFMSNMADIGIKVKVVKVPWMSVIDEMAQMETSAHIVTVFDSPHFPEAGSLIESRYHSSSAPTWEQNEWLLDPELDALIERSIATVDRTERFALYAQIQHTIVDLCPSIFPFEDVERHAYRSDRIVWPAAEGEVNPIMGYPFAARLIRILP